MTAAVLRSREAGVAGVLALTALVVGMVDPAFLGMANLGDIAVAAAPALIVACGMTLVLVMGEIDLSVGALMGLCAAVLGRLVSADHAALPVWAAASLVLVLGAGIGALNGLLVTVGRVPSIIATLGTGTALAGIADLVMGGGTIGNFPEALRTLAIGRLGPVPIPVVVAVVCVLAFSVLARHTPLGLRIHAAGSDPHAARLIGLPVQRLRMLVFTCTGALTGLATLVSAPQLDVIEAGFGRHFELLVITGVVVGGAAIGGGRGTIVGAALAVLLLALVRTALVFLHLGIAATYWERAIQGAFILVAVVWDHLHGRGRWR